MVVQVEVRPLRTYLFCDIFMPQIIVLGNCLHTCLFLLSRHTKKLVECKLKQTAHEPCPITAEMSVSASQGKYSKCCRLERALRVTIVIY